MLWGTKLPLAKKIGATIVLSAGVFVLVCSLLKTVFVMTVSPLHPTSINHQPKATLSNLTCKQDPVNGAQLAGEWGTREAFVSVVCTNLPMLFPLIKAWLKPIFGSALNSNQTPSSKHPSGFRTIGGDVTTQATTRTRRGVPSSNHYSGGLSSTESEERIVREYKMQDMEAGTNQKGIVISSEFEVTEGRVDSRVLTGTGNSW